MAIIHILKKALPTYSMTQPIVLPALTCQCALIPLHRLRSELYKCIRTICSHTHSNATSASSISVNTNYAASYANLMKWLEQDLLPTTRSLYIRRILCLSVSVSVQNITKSYERISMKFCRQVECGPGNRGVASIFGLGSFSPEAYLLPFLLPFLPLLLLPSLSFSFSFRLLPFSSRILFPEIPSSYHKSSYVWKVLWHHKFTTSRG